MCGPVLGVVAAKGHWQVCVVAMGRQEISSEVGEAGSGATHLDAYILWWSRNTFCLSNSHLNAYLWPLLDCGASGKRGCRVLGGNLGTL